MKNDIPRVLEKALNFSRALEKISGLWADKPMDTDTYVRSLRDGNRKNIRVDRS